VTDNDDLELKKRSRRRLVGAGALALTAAIVLPMVMDGEPGVTTHDIQVIIPDRDADIRLARPIAGRSAMLPMPETAPAPFEQEPLDEIGAPTDELAPYPPVASLNEPPSAALRLPAAPDTGPAAGETRPRAETPQRAPSGRPAAEDEAARVKAILEGRAGPETPLRARSFVVQVGAFGEASKAASLSSDLNNQGFKAFTEDAGAMTRVRIGPFTSRSEAESTADRLGALGHNGVVTAQ
jgi:DedD protein